MVWTAGINSSGDEILVTRSSAGIDYRSDSYPLIHLQCRRWVENTHNYLALILLQRNEVVITITDDPASPNLGNILLGSTVPSTAYNSFAALTSVGSGSAAGGSSGGSVVTSTTFTRSGGLNILDTGFDIPLSGRTRRFVSTNLTANLYFVQIHDSATPLISGALPSAAEIYQLPPNATLALTCADLGEYGTVFGVNPRIALSTTFGVYTPVNAVAAQTISFFIESL